MQITSSQLSNNFTPVTANGMVHSIVYLLQLEPQATQCHNLHAPTNIQDMLVNFNILHPQTATCTLQVGIAIYGQTVQLPILDDNQKYFHLQTSSTSNKCGGALYSTMPRAVDSTLLVALNT